MSAKTPAHNDPKATQRLRLGDTPDLASISEPHLDPKATQVVRVADASATQPSRHESDVPHASGGRSERFSLRPWMVRHKRALILVAVLVGIALLAISGVAIWNAWDLQRATVGIGGLQMRAARLAQADLSGQDLKWANLAQADLRQANLSGADLLGADLGGADLSEANLDAAVLRGADLSGAKLRQAVLTRADLHWAVMRNADLSQADLREADLRGADLENSILEGANLEGADLDNVHTAGTILPDGSVWTPRTNLRRFTDPTHPEFWRPGDAQSLAHR
jgi:uncharacterized protein YjbI with pentapeptide repeats